MEKEKRIYIRTEEGKKESYKPNSFQELINQLKHLEKQEIERVDNNSQFMKTLWKKAEKLTEEINETEVVSELRECRGVIESSIKAIRDIKRISHDNECDSLEEEFKYLLYLVDDRIDTKLENEKCKTKPNRPKKEISFSDLLLNCNKEKVIKRLHILFINAKGKKASTILIALKELEYIILPERGKQAIYDVINREFGLNLTNSHYQAFIKITVKGLETTILQTEIDEVKQMLQK